MRLLSLATRGLIPNPRHELRLNVEELPRGVVALVGKNGVGKSTFTEATIPGTLFRKFPTRGSLAALAVADDAFSEAVIEHRGRRLKIRQEEGSARIEDESGAPLLRSAGVREFETWVRNEFPDEDLFLAADFIAQKSAGFCDLPTAERKSVILSAIGVSRFETLATEAGKRLSAANVRLRELATRREEARRGAEGLEAVVGLENAARLDVAAARGALDRTRTALDEAKRLHAAALESFSNAEAARTRRKPLVTRRSELSEKLRDIVTRHSNREKLSVHAETIRRAAEDLPAARAKLDAATTSERAASDAAAKADGAVREIVSASRILDAELSKFEWLAADRTGVEEDLEAAKACAGELPKLLDERDRLQKEHATQVEEWTRLREVVRAGLAPRVEKLRAGLSAIACGSRGGIQESQEFARKVVAEDDSDARKATDAPAAEKAADLAVERSREAVRTTERRIEEAKRAESDVGDLAGALVRIAEREKIRDAKLAERAGSTSTLDEANEFALRAGRDARVAVEVVGAERAWVAKLVAASARIAEVRAMDSEAAEDAATERAVIAEQRSIDRALAELPEPGEVAPPPSFGPEEKAVAEAEAELQRAAAKIGAAEARTRAAQEAEERRVALDAEIAAASEEASDWTILSRALGRDGIQALEIDAAGPELAALANGFLGDCYGPRWSVSLLTTRQKDGGGDREVYDLLVHDAEAPPEKTTCELRWKSGGESVIVGEAIALALSTFAASRAGGAAGATWVRDESGASLDGPKGIAYVQMLRRAAELAGAERVLLVSHSPAVQAAADARVFFDGAALRVE